MSDRCNSQNSCHSHEHHHDSCGEDHHHHHSCCCGSDQGTCHEHHHEEGDFADQLLELADEAWMDVLREKIKEQVIISEGKNLEQLAKLVADANKTKWKYKLGKHHECDTFKEQVSEFFNKNH